MKKFFIFSLLLMIAFGLCLSAEAAVISSSEAYKTFVGALGGARGYLNANRMTGTVGASEYLENAELRTALTAFIAEKKPATRELLDWFKAQFLLNTGNVLTNRDKGDSKSGIQGAIIAKYKEICYGTFKNESKSGFKAYKTEIVPLVKTRTDAIKTCQTNYVNCVKVLTPNEKEVKIEACKNDKDMCSNAAYTAYFVDVKNKYSEKLGAKLEDLNSCLANERITGWQWAQTPTN